MDACRRDFEQAPATARAGANSRGFGPRATARPVRAVALVFAWEEDPVLLSIRPTRDAAMLDAMARVLRTALLTGRSVASVVTELGDARLKRLYFSRGLPPFIYDGVPAPVRHRIPTQLQQALGRRRAR